MTRAYQFVHRDGKFVEIEVEKMTNDERIAVFSGYHPSLIISWLNVVCETLNEAENTINHLKGKQ